MNWKEHAHLFANGKFKVLIESHATDNVIITIRSIDVSMIEVGDVRINKTTKASDCTLIARPISDMTNDEVLGITGHKELRDITIIGIKGSWEDHANMGALRFNRALEFISIGVYPFDQNHFDTGEILNTNSIKE